jgi:hypothetical protein
VRENFGAREARRRVRPLKRTHRAVGDAVAADVGGGGLQRIVVDVDAHDVGAAEHVPRDSQDATAGAKVQHGLRRRRRHYS